MRTLPELQSEIRPSLDNRLAWPLLLSIHAEASDAGGGTIARSIHQLAWCADISSHRVPMLLGLLADAKAIAFEPAGERTYQVTVL